MSCCSPSFTNCSLLSYYTHLTYTLNKWTGRKRHQRYVIICCKTRHLRINLTIPYCFNLIDVWILLPPLRLSGQKQSENEVMDARSSLHFRGKNANFNLLSVWKAPMLINTRNVISIKNNFQQKCTSLPVIAA